MRGSVARLASWWQAGPSSPAALPTHLSYPLDRDSMDPRDAFASVLRGDFAATLEPADREALEEIAHAAQGERRLPAMREECASRLRQGAASPAVEYLLAAVCALNGEVERAHQTLLALGERLAAAKRWEPL